MATLKSEVEEQGKELRALNQKVDALVTKVDNVDGKLTQILTALASMQGMHLLFSAFGQCLIISLFRPAVVGCQHPHQSLCHAVMFKLVVYWAC